MGRTSAPRFPQPEQMKRGSRSDSLISSGQRSPLTVVQWLQ